MLIGLESSRCTGEGCERHWRMDCWCQTRAMGLTVWTTHMRRGGQTALGREEFLLRLRCQGGCLGSNSLICRGRIGGRQGGTTNRERFL